jgi:hypothetical protein
MKKIEVVEVYELPRAPKRDEPLEIKNEPKILRSLFHLLFLTRQIRD